MVSMSCADLRTCSPKFHYFLAVAFFSYLFPKILPRQYRMLFETNWRYPGIEIDKMESQFTKGFSNLYMK